MSKIKLVLADLDGTVVMPASHEATEEVHEAIRQGERAGLMFSVVTGRPYWMAEALLKSLSIDQPCVFDGGGCIANPTTGEVLWSKYLPAETARQAVSLMLPHAIEIEYDKGVRNPKEVNIDQIQKPSLSVWASVKAESAENLINELRKLPNAAVHGNPHPGGDTSKWGIQVTHAEADKKHAVQQLLKMLKVDKNHTLAIGDGNNDLPLFDGTAVRVAMGNSTELLKKKADHVVSTVHEDGFAEAIRRIVLGEN